MYRSQKVIGGFNPGFLFYVLETCAQLPNVRVEVRKNHDDNLWWPKSISDWRLRMVIAGWSTRISYRMIESFRKIVSDVNRVGYEDLCKMSRRKLYDLIGPLGLFESRREYLNSLHAFLESLEKIGKLALEIPNDEFITLISNNVKGASYKVAQCAALYAKGYHCGIFPVDSGMKDMLGPCLGLQLPSGPIAHDIMRRHLERAINSIPDDLRLLAQESGYNDLSIPLESAPTWWSHLVLIYFKRLYCNKKNPNECPLRENAVIGKFMGSMCSRNSPQIGGFKHIILEGPDMVGKSTVAEKLREMGYLVFHSPYNPYHYNIFEHYKSIIENTSGPAVFDRTFISEITYGMALRGYSRLSDREFIDLLRLLSEKGYILLYLNENLDTIRQRLALSDHEEHMHSLSNLNRLLSEYDKCISTVSEYIPVFQFCPTKSSQDKILELINQVIERGTRSTYNWQHIS